jgi:uncharacterized protein YfdQ (DUF2303 family)
MDANKEYAEWLQNRAGIELKTLTDADGEEIKVAAVPVGWSLQSVKKLLDEYLPAPERRKGVATAHDLDSLIAHVNRFKDDNSALFADGTDGSPALIGVINYHRAGAETGDEARFGDHRVVYRFPLSDEWAAWTANNGQRMSQADFAEFLENRILDVAPPPSEKKADDPLAEIAKTLGGTFASASRLLELSRGLAISAKINAKGAINLSTGEAQITFDETHADGRGAPLKVPNLFAIAIPVFRQGAVYRIPVRLRYRLLAGAVSWSYELYRADKAFDHAFREAASKAQKDTGLPLFYGTPEG